MNHYGVENFSVSLIEETTAELANARECFWIKELDTQSPNGYNMTSGGGGGHTIQHWDDGRKREHYRKQGEKRKGPRSVEFKTAMSDAAKKREANRSPEEKRLIGEKISQTMKARGVRWKPNITFGIDNPNYVEIDTEKVCELIKLQWKLKDIAELFNTTTVTVSAKLKAATGKTFLDWRKEYGIKGSFGSVQRIDPTELPESS